MNQDLLKIEHLAASVEDKEILKDVSLKIGRGETHVIMGPNGAGKSTLAGVLMGNPAYEVTDGNVQWEDEDLLELSVSERAKKGLFLSFQNPVEVPGISLENFVRSAISQKTGKPIRIWSFKKEVKAALETLGMDQSYAERDLNVGFSGGEKKKAEILQLLLMKPTLAILDETDSGLDVDAMRIVAEGVNKLQTPETSCIVITHYDRLLEMIRPQFVHVLYKGRIVKTGGPELAQQIQEHGYDWIKEEIGEE